MFPLVNSNNLKEKQRSYTKEEKKFTKFYFLFFLGLIFLTRLVSDRGVTLEDTKGNKYTFKNQSLTCLEKYQGMIHCEGSAIKKDILGKRYVVDFQSEYCKTLRDGKIFSDLICSAAKKMGKL